MTANTVPLRFIATRREKMQFFIVFYYQSREGVWIQVIISVKDRFLFGICVSLMKQGDYANFRYLADTKVLPEFLSENRLEEGIAVFW